MDVAQVELKVRLNAAARTRLRSHHATTRRTHDPPTFPASPHAVLSTAIGFHLPERVSNLDAGTRTPVTRPDSMRISAEIHRVVASTQGECKFTGLTSLGISHTHLATRLTGRNQTGEKTCTDGTNSPQMPAKHGFTLHGEVCAYAHPSVLIAPLSRPDNTNVPSSPSSFVSPTPTVLATRLAPSATPPRIVECSPGLPRSVRTIGLQGPEPAANSPCPKTSPTS
jgi:hypothetical protein